MDRNYLVKISNEFLGIEIPDLLMKFLSCNGFTKNINSNVIYFFLHGCWNDILKNSLLCWNEIQIT